MSALARAIANFNESIRFQVYREIALERDNVATATVEIAPCVILNLYGFVRRGHPALPGAGEDKNFSGAAAGAVWKLFSGFPAGPRVQCLRAQPTPLHRSAREQGYRRNHAERGGAGGRAVHSAAARVRAGDHRRNAGTG